MLLKGGKSGVWGVCLVLHKMTQNEWTIEFLKLLGCSLLENWAKAGQ